MPIRHLGVAAEISLAALNMTQGAVRPHPPRRALRAARARAAAELHPQLAGRLHRLPRTVARVQGRPPRVVKLAFSSAAPCPMQALLPSVHARPARQSL